MPRVRGATRARRLVLAVGLAAGLLALLAGPTLASASGVGSRAYAPGDHVLTLRAAGLTRTVLVHVPPGAAVASRPLLLVFHGHGDTAASTAQGTDFESVADRTDEVVAFLQGIDDRWNDLGHATNSPNPNDVAFAAASIPAIAAHTSFDPHRVVAVGFSNGALMVEELGCRLASKLAMVVPVEGELSTVQSSHCAPSRAIGVYEIHGTADASIPYGGGQFGGPGGPVELSAPHSVARWASLDHCARTSTRTTVSSSVYLTTYRSCRRKVVVTLRTIKGGVHQWGSTIGWIVHAALPPP